jgi:predicted ATP-grasp superfamily ATP-dependent carboligase
MARSRGVKVRRVADDGAEEAFLDILKDLAADGPGVVITGSDRASEWMALNRDAIPAQLKTFEGPGSGHLDLIGKRRSTEIAIAAGVGVPWSRVAQNEQELREVGGDAPFPCVVKPELSHEYRQLFGDERVFVANDIEEAVRHATPALGAGLAIVLSELIPGGDDAVEEAIVVRAADGSYPVSFGCRKLRQYPPGFGAASLAVSDPIPESMELARAVLDEAGYFGVVGVETKRHAVTGKRYFLEANVRLPTQWGLGDRSGADASVRLIATLTGDPLPPQPPVSAGVKFMFPELEAHAAAKLMGDARWRERPKLARELLHAWKGTREFGVLSPSDPMPGVTRIGRAALNRGRRSKPRRSGGARP